ncbi:sodium:solute symporter family protein [Coraliomargarita sp. W4R72]
MSWVDWTVIAVLSSGLLGSALYAMRLTSSVSGFLSANRCAGRYLLTLADGMAAFGAITLVANFEKFYEAGFGAFWWGMILAPLASIAALSGWVAYRYRETRSLTMGEYFERRYSRKFRIYAGILCWFSGIFNYGIFPMITADLLVNFFGFAPHFELGGFIFSTNVSIMVVMLSIAVTLTLTGGLITVMVTDFIQSQVLFIALLAVVGMLLFRFDWNTVSEGLLMAPSGQSRVNPFDQKLLDSFNLFFFSVFAFKIFYNYLGWQGSQGYFSAARSPHEFRMSRILGEWRSGIFYLIMLLPAIGAFVFFNHPQFAADAAGPLEILSGIDDPKMAARMAVPNFLVYLLPAGVMGLFASALIFMAISTDDTQLHSWGTIFVQDVLMPLYGKPFSQKTHMLLLRFSVIAVAVFALLWSTFFPLRDYILMYMLATGTIYLGGSGAVIIGGLYWRRATTAGAWAAMTTGAVIGLGGVLSQAFWPSLTMFHGAMPDFPFNGVQIAVSSYFASILVFVTVSLLTSKVPFNLERLLHRGEFSVNQDHASAEVVVSRQIPAWQRRIGVNSEFTKGDRIIYFAQIAWTSFWLLVFIGGTIAAVTIGFSDQVWLGWWKFVVLLTIVVGLFTVIWFLIGGIRDFRDLVRRLKEEETDETDDGWVVEPTDKTQASQ